MTNLENLEKQFKELLDNMEEGYVYEISILKKPCIDVNYEKDMITSTNWYKVLANQGKDGLMDKIKFLDKAGLVKLAKSVGVQKPSVKEGKIELMKRIVEKMESTLNIGKVFRS